MAQQKKQQDKEAMGNSRGGLSTKIHAAVDALGNPVRFILRAGQFGNLQSEALIDGASSLYFVADKGYDSDEFIAAIETNQRLRLYRQGRTEK